MQPRKPPEAALDPDVELDELEHDIEALRLAYEKYFLGIDRAAPVRQRDRLDRRFRILEGGHMRTTMLRFRFAGLRSRYVTYGHYWARVLDQIERGIWRRDLARNTPRAASTDPPAADAPTQPPANGANGAAAPVPTTAIDPQHARDVFDRLIAAKIAAGETTDGLTFPAFLRKLSREAPKLQEQSGGKPVTLDVEVRGGKVRVRVRSQ